MRSKIFAAVVPALFAAAAIVPLTAAPASADPLCAEDVYGSVVHSGSQDAYKVVVTLNRCGRPTRAMAKCAALGGSGTNYGPSITRGTSRTDFCARGSEMVKSGWQVYYNGKWNSRWVE